MSDKDYYYKIGDVVAYRGPKNGASNGTPKPVVITGVQTNVSFTGIHRYYNITDGHNFTDSYVSVSDLHPGGNMTHWPNTEYVRNVFAFASVIRTIVISDPAINPQEGYDIEMPAFEYGEKE